MCCYATGITKGYVNVVPQENHQDMILFTSEDGDCCIAIPKRYIDSPLLSQMTDENIPEWLYQFTDCVTPAKRSIARDAFLTYRIDRLDDEFSNLVCQVGGRRAFFGYKFRTDSLFHDDSYKASLSGRSMITMEASRHVQKRMCIALADRITAISRFAGGLIIDAFDKAKLLTLEK